MGHAFEVGLPVPNPLAAVGLPCLVGEALCAVAVS